MLTIFYDSFCPLCVHEMQHLKKLDKSEKLTLIDIHSPEQMSQFPDIDPQACDRILHALDEQGSLLLGLDVTHRAWQLVGKGALVAPLRWPLISVIADKIYLLFARHRYTISRWLTGKARCDQQCRF